MISEKRKRFCHEYVVDFNGKRAAIRTGYSAKSATTQACLILSDPRVQEYLKKLTAKQEAKLKVTAERVIDELGRLAFSDIGAYYKRDEAGNVILRELDELTVEQRAAVVEHDVEKKILKLASKDPSLDKLGKHFKLFSELNDQVHTFTIMPELKLGGKTIIFNVGEPVKKK